MLSSYLRRLTGVVLATGAAALYILNATPAMASVSAVRVTDGADVYAEEAKAGLTEVPLTIEIDLTLELLGTSHLFSLGNLATRVNNASHNQFIDAVSVNALEYSFNQPGCGIIDTDDTSQVNRLGAYFSYQASLLIGCSEQTLTMTFTKMDYSRDVTGGLLYFRDFSGIGNPVAIPLVGATTKEAYSLNAAAPFDLEAVVNQKTVDAAQTALVDADLFRLRGDVDVDESLRLLSDDDTAVADVSDVKLVFTVSGNLNFLRADANGNRKRLVLRSSESSTEIPFVLDDEDNPTSASAMTAKRAETGGSFTVSVAGTSDTLFEFSDVEATASLQLVRNGVLFDVDKFKDTSLAATTRIDGAILSTGVTMALADPARTFAAETARYVGNEVFKVAIDLPAIKDGEISIALFNRPDGTYSALGEGVRYKEGGGELTLAVSCGTVTSVGPDANGVERAVISFDAQGCPEQSVELVYDSLDYRSAGAGDTMYVGVSGDGVSDTVTPLSPVNLVNAYDQGNSASAFEVAPYKDTVTTARGDDSAILDNLLFRVVSNIAVNSSVEFATPGGETVTAEGSDVVLTLRATGDLDFLQPDGQGKAKRLYVRATRALRQSAYFTFDESNGSQQREAVAQIRLSGLLDDETFEVSVNGMSDTSFVPGQLTLEVSAKLEKRDLFLQDDRIEQPQMAMLTIEIDNEALSNRAVQVEPVVFAAEVEQNFLRSVERVFTVNLPALRSGGVDSPILLTFTNEVNGHNRNQGIQFSNDFSRGNTQNSCVRIEDEEIAFDGSYSFRLVSDRALEDCPGGDFSFRILGMDYRRSIFAGRLYARLEEENSGNVISVTPISAPVVTEEAYRFSSPYRVDTQAGPIRTTNNLNGELDETTLFTVNGGDVTINRGLRFSDSNSSLEPDITDMKLALTITGNLIFTRPATFNDPNQRTIEVQSSAGGPPVVFTVDSSLRTARATLTRRQSLSESFVISVKGDGSGLVNAFETTKLVLSVAPILEKTGIDFIPSTGKHMPNSPTDIVGQVAIETTAFVRLVSGDGLYASESRANFTDFPVVLDVDLPGPMSRDSIFSTISAVGLTVTIGNGDGNEGSDRFVHDQLVRRVRTSESMVGVTVGCGEWLAGRREDSLALELEFFKETAGDCPFQTARTTIPLDFSQVEGESDFFVRLRNLTGGDESFNRITAARFEPAFVESQTMPFAVAALLPVQQTSDNTNQQLVNSRLFTAVGDVLVDETAGISPSDPSIKAAVDHVVLTFTMSGDLGFLLPDSAGASKKLQLSSSIAGATSVPFTLVDPLNPTTATATLKKQAETGEQFFVEIIDSSGTAFVSGNLALVVDVDLVGPDGIQLDAGRLKASATRAATTRILVNGTVSAAVVSDYGTYAEEARSAFSKLPIRIEIDVPAMGAGESVAFALQNGNGVNGTDGFAHDQSAARLRTNGDDLQGSAACGSFGDVSVSDSAGVGFSFSADATDCPQQTVTLEYDGFDYTADTTDGAFYIATSYGNAELAGAQFAPAYRSSLIEPLMANALSPTFGTISLVNTALSSNALFAISGGVNVEDTFLLSPDRNGDRAQIGDVKLVLRVTGDLAFLQADSAGNAKQLRVTSSAGGTPVVFTPDPDVAGGFVARVAKSAENAEIFTLSVSGSSNQPYEAGSIALSASFTLERDGHQLDASTLENIPAVTSSTLLELQQLLIDANLVTAQVRSGDLAYAEEALAARRINASALPLSITVGLPSIPAQAGAQLLTFVLGNNAIHDDSASAVRVGNGSLTVSGACGSLREQTLNADRSVQAVFATPDSGCNAQELILTHSGFDYRQDVRDGAFVLGVFVDNVLIRSFDLAGARFGVDAYALDRIAFDESLNDTAQVLGTNSNRLERSQLFAFDLAVQVADRKTGLSFTDSSLVAEVEDVKFDLVLSGSLGFLASDSNGARKTAGVYAAGTDRQLATLAVDPGNSRIARGRMVLTEADFLANQSGDADTDLVYGGTYELRIEGTSRTPFEQGMLEFSIIPDLEKETAPATRFADASITGASIRSSINLEVDLSLINDPGVSFVLPWVSSSSAIPVVGSATDPNGQAVPTDTVIIVSNLVNKTVGPVLVRLNDSSGLLGDAGLFVELGPVIPPFSTVTISLADIEAGLGDFGRGTLEFRIAGATKKDLALRRFTDVGGDFYVDTFGDASNFEEFAPND